MRSIFQLLSALFLLSSCANQIKMGSLTPEEKSYLEKIATAKTSFELPKAKSEDAWARGTTFVNQYSGMRIQTSSDYILNTFSPSIEGGTIGYQLSRSPKGDKFAFSVICHRKWDNFKYTKAVCENNERILSYYMQTGEINPKFVDAVVDTKEEKKK